MGCLVFQNAISFICYSFGWEDGASLSYDKHEVGQFKLSFFYPQVLDKVPLPAKGETKKGNQVRADRFKLNLYFSHKSLVEALTS